MPNRPTVLFVANVNSRAQARDLAYAFEEFGRLVRCDIPRPRGASESETIAFVEFEDWRDAEDAYVEMHGRRFEGRPLQIEYAKNANPRSRAEDRDRSPPRRHDSPPARHASPRRDLPVRRDSTARRESPARQERLQSRSPRRGEDIVMEDR